MDIVVGLSLVRLSGCCSCFLLCVLFWCWFWLWLWFMFFFFFVFLLLLRCRTCAGSCYVLFSYLATTQLVGPFVVHCCRRTGRWIGSTALDAAVGVLVQEQRIGHTNHRVGSAERTGPSTVVCCCRGCCCLDCCVVAAASVGVVVIRVVGPGREVVGR